MKYSASRDTDNGMDFQDMDNRFFLIGLLNAFVNHLQMSGDRFFEEISWKQCFLLICLNYFEQPPTLKELAETVGSSHQNVKQMLLKMEKAGFLVIETDKEDKRKQRIVLTEKAAQFNRKYEVPSQRFMENLFAGIDEKAVEITVQTILQMEERLKGDN